MHQGAWQAAIDALSVLSAGSNQVLRARDLVWQSRCLLHLGKFSEAMSAAVVALETIPDKRCSLAQYARLNIARSLRQKGGRLSDALKLLAGWVIEFPRHPLLRQYLVECLCKAHGDWKMAARLAKPLFKKPGHERDVDWFLLNRQLFCGAASPEALSQDIQSFAVRHQQPFSAARVVESCKTSLRSATHRHRVGLVSTLFRASPVYFLCVGALRLLSRDMDLVFFSRETSQDWAAAELRSIASEWHEVGGLRVDALDKVLRNSNLDALIDMSGWIDPAVMHTLAMRPVARQYKWVGGQSSTTGIRAFDGFICDEHQVPANLSHLYSEPLAHMPGGYVTYVEPAYMPESRARTPHADGHMVGVISHPMKVSPAFLAYLRQHIEQYAQQDGPSVCLQFIGRRFADALLQRRIDAALGMDADGRREQVRLEFVPTTGHRAQLEAVAALDWVVDTFPYTSGVTALEALALGVPIRTHAGAHFSARHGYSHARFAGLRDSDVALQQLGPFAPSNLVKTGTTLLQGDCPRRDHQRLAHDLAAFLHSGASD